MTRFTKCCDSKGRDNFVVLRYVADSPKPSEAGMAYYALFYDVVDDFVARRAAFREEHLSLAHDAHRSGELVLAGALADPADSALLVFRGDSPDVAHAFAERDPYVRHGLVKHWEVRPWTVVVGGESPNTSAGQGGS